MPRIPRYQGQSPITAAVNPVRVNPAYAGTGGAALQGAGKALGGIATTMQERLDKQKAAKDKAWVARSMSQARITAIQRIHELQQSAPLGADGFTETAMDTLNKEFVAIRGQAVSDEAAADFDAQIQSVITSSFGSAMEFEAGRKATQRVQDIDDAISDNANAVRLDPDASTQMIAEISGAIDASGANAGVRAKKMEEARQAIITAKARAMIARDPESGIEYLNSDEAQSVLTDSGFNTLLVAAQNEVEAREKQAVSDAEKAERDAEKRLKRAGDELTKDAWERFEAGQLTESDLRDIKPFVSPTQYRAIQKALHGDEALEDDRDTVAELLPLLHEEDISDRLHKAYADGRLKTSTYRSLLDGNIAALADDRPASPNKSARSLVKNTLNPAGLLDADAARIAAAGSEQALLEFDNWAKQHPEATRQEYIAEAQAIISRYQLLDFSAMEFAKGLPRFYSGTRQALSLEDIAEAKRRTLEAFDRGELSEGEAAHEARKLDEWEQILSRKPQQPRKPSND